MENPKFILLSVSVALFPMSLMGLHKYTIMQNKKWYSRFWSSLVINLGLINTILLVYRIGTAPMLDWGNFIISSAAAMFLLVGYVLMLYMYIMEIQFSFLYKRKE